ncbi:cobalt-precorrin 5A hydrolase [Desulfothermus sp.]
MVTENKIAIYVLNKFGLRVAQKILEYIDSAELFVKKGVTKNINSHEFNNIKSIVKENFFKYKSHIFICATGIVVRTICPFICSKDIDPAIVVIDPAGKYVISLLSGHLGGANSLARYVAKKITAIPVITTATDSFNLPAIDEIARILNLTIDDIKKIKIINSAILNHKPIFVYDPLNYLNIQSFFPSDYSLVIKSDLNNIKKSDIGIICDYKENKVDNNKIILYPKVLYVGIGCNKGTHFSEILDLFNCVFSEENLAADSVCAIVTTDRKSNEQGIIEFTKFLKKELIFIDHFKLDKIKVPNPSENVKRHMGVPSVSEACAIIASKGRLVVEKRKSKNVTIAVAIKDLTYSK